MKKIIWLLLLIVIFTPIKKVWANDLAQVVFINQVRGSDCCDQGNFDFFANQLAIFQANHLPVTFVLRFDVLSDQKYLQALKHLPTNIEVGAFLEITSQLAQAAGVEYQATKDNWYEAENAYLLGYTQDQRQKLIDQYMKVFKTRFGWYPKVVTAWMIDTFSTNYLQDKYGVNVVQITREQWGTDSYTLFGGPVHYPYLSSRNWNFMPGQDGMMMLRQTGSDPLYNYADSQSLYTTQPNDYLRDSKDFSYFQKLSTQLLFDQLSPGFLLLGLENSIDQKYQDEFFNQIKFIDELAKDSKVKVIAASQISQLQDYMKTGLSLVRGNDLINQTGVKTIWVNALKYRVRILLTPTFLAITDFRVYSDQFIDPYQAYPAQKLGYLITPFLVDGAHFKAQKELNPSLSTLISNLILPENKYQPGQLESTFDFQAAPVAINFENFKQMKNEKFDNSELTLTYQTTNDKNVSVIFTPEKISFLGSAIKDQLLNQLAKIEQEGLISLKQNQNDINIFFGDQQFSLAQLSCEHDDQCQLSPTLTNADYHLLPAKDKQSLFPEIIADKIDLLASNIYLHNPYQIEQAAPSRLVVTPRNNQGSLVQNNDNLAVFLNHDPALSSAQHGFWGFIFTDLFPQKYGVNKVRVVIGKEVKELNLYYAPNCKQQKVNCLVHPQYLWWNLLSKGMEKLRTIN